MLNKLFWKCVYAFNRNMLSPFSASIIVGNTRLYVEGDEYVKLRADGWVIVKSKKYKDSTDMLPINLVSSGCIELIVKSAFFNANKIIKEMNEEINK